MVMGDMNIMGNLNVIDLKEKVNINLNNLIIFIMDNGDKVNLYVYYI